MSPELFGTDGHTDPAALAAITEEDIAGQSAPSSETWQNTLRAALLTQDVKGLRILDVGGGASDFTAKLLELGADAYAIDPKYAHMSRLKHWVRKGNEQFLDLTGMHLDYKELLKSFERFKLSTGIHKDRYKAAFATHMPFPDNYFDVVFSQFAVLGYVDVNMPILTRAVYECLRVTKPGGSIRLNPYEKAPMGFAQEASDARINNDRAIVQLLSADPQVEKIYTQFVSVRSGSVTLAIQKAAQ